MAFRLPFAIKALKSKWCVAGLPSGFIRAILFGPNPRAGYSDPLIEPEEVRTTIRNHPEFGAFRDRVHAILDGWAGQNAPLMDGTQIGDKPKDLIHTIAEDMLTRFAEAPLIDQYEAYQRLMSYWAETMQVDVFIIAHEGWEAAKELREARKEVDGKKVKWLEEADLTVNKVRLVADVIPPALIVARFFPDMQQALEDAQAKAEELGREIEELVEEHGVEGGLLADALTEAGKLTAASVKTRQKSGEAEPEEAKLLKQVAKLMTSETAAKKAVKEAEEALTEATLKQYPELTEEDTGTPLLKSDKGTSLETFGPYIGKPYRFDEAVEDGVVLDLRYEARDIDQRISAPGKIDALFEAKTKGLTPIAKAALKQRWGTLQRVLSSRDRLEQIANDIIMDMEMKPRLHAGISLIPANSPTPSKTKGAHRQTNHLPSCRIS